MQRRMTNITEIDNPQVNAKKELINCSKCDKPAYFWCNRNICDRDWCRINRGNMFAWKGCGKPVCWNHFKFEYFIDHERNNAKTIMSWHCVDDGSKTSVCSVKRQTRNCCCMCCLMSPAWIGALIFLIWNLVNYFNISVIESIMK